MPANNASQPGQPVQPGERYSSLDVLRGIALFGVLAMNLLYFFRLSLWDHILHFHSHPGWLNSAIDLFAAGVIEFKAFHCFALTFGIGMAIQAERAEQRGGIPELFLVRRFLVLLAIGAFHMVLISNVDILMLYAVCGLALTLLIRLPAIALAIVGIAAIYLPAMLPAPHFPNHAGLENWAIAATEHYSHGTFADILAFRWSETRTLNLPVLIETAQNTAGIMLLGLAFWKSGIIRAPRRFRSGLWIFIAIFGSIGILNTAAELMPHVAANGFHTPPLIDVFGAHVPLALAYAACVFALNPDSTLKAWTAPFAAAGQMALTNYLTQSIVFALIFYGYGLGLFDRLPPAPVAAFGVAFYILQLGLSQWWLSRYRFGPVEWLWRSATYGRIQPMALR